MMREWPEFYTIHAKLQIRVHSDSEAWWDFTLFTQIHLKKKTSFNYEKVKWPPNALFLLV